MIKVNQSKTKRANNRLSINLLNSKSSRSINIKNKFISHLVKTQQISISERKQGNGSKSKQFIQNYSKLKKDYTIPQIQFNLKHQEKRQNQRNLLVKCKSNINKIHALNKILKQSQKQQVVEVRNDNCKVKTIRFIDKIKSGGFASVFKAKFVQNGKLIAIKKIYFDSQHHQREQQICKLLKNEFIVKIIGIYHNQECAQSQRFDIRCEKQTQAQNNKTIVIHKDNIKAKKIHKSKVDKNNFFWNYTECQPVCSANVCNIIMDLYDCDLSQYISLNSEIDHLNLKLFTYQILRGILYLHSNNICHRDIKPKNILVEKHKIVISDFGSAKIFSKTKSANVSYICSRNYRAPELIFGQKYYDTSIDIWSIGCVFAQMVLKEPIFSGSSVLDQLISILRVLGTPNWRNLSFAKQNFPKIPYIQGKGLKSIFSGRASDSFIDLLQRMLIINPLKRINAAQALIHPYFDQLRDQMSFGQINRQFQISSFLKFNREQLKKSQHFKNRLVPLWFRQQEGIFKFKSYQGN